MTNNRNGHIDLAAKLVACQALDARGCKMTLCHPRGKEPYMVGWTAGLALEEMAERLSRRPTDNIGVVTGKPSDGLVCIDLDNSIAVELADQYLPLTPLVVGRGENPRTHWFYHVPGGIKATKFKLPADLIAGEGAYVGIQVCRIHGTPIETDVVSHAWDTSSARASARQSASDRACFSATGARATMEIVARSGAERSPGHEHGGRRS